MVYQDDCCSAFMDIQPINPGHTLVIPNRHAGRLVDLDEEEGAQMFRVAQRLAAALYKSEVRCEGVDFFLADGAAAGQEVFHIHLHIFPRYVGDGFSVRFREQTQPSGIERDCRQDKKRAAIEITLFTTQR